AERSAGGLVYTRLRRDSNSRRTSAKCLYFLYSKSRSTSSSRGSASSSPSGLAASSGSVRGRSIRLLIASRVAAITKNSLAISSSHSRMADRYAMYWSVMRAMGTSQTSSSDCSMRWRRRSSGPSKPSSLIVTSIPLSLQLPQQIGHLDGGDGCLPSLVSRFGPGPLDRLFDGIHGDHSEDDRHAVFEGGAGHPLGHFTGHVVKMGRRPPNHRPQGNHRVVAAGRGHPVGHERNFKGSRNPRDLHRVVGNPVAIEVILRPRQQLAGDEFVKSADDDANAEPLTDQFPFIYLRHRKSPFLSKVEHVSQLGLLCPQIMEIVLIGRHLDRQHFDDLQAVPLHAAAFAAVVGQ